MLENAGAINGPGWSDRVVFDDISAEQFMAVGTDPSTSYKKKRERKYKSGTLPFADNAAAEMD